MSKRELVLTTNKGTGCIECTSHKYSNNGTLRLSINGKLVSYHAFLYKESNGEIPEGFMVIRNCGNTKCMNVDHMELKRAVQMPIINGCKICTKCGENKPESEYTFRKKDTRHGVCKSCCADNIKRSQSNKPFNYICRRIKARCKSRGLDFNLTPEYLESIWVDTCPILGTPIKILPPSVSGKVIEGELDRFDPDKGYVIGNVNFISTKANRMKSDGSITDLKNLLHWMESKQ